MPNLCKIKQRVNQLKFDRSLTLKVITYLKKVWDIMQFISCMLSIWKIFFQCSHLNFYAAEHVFIDLNAHHTDSEDWVCLCALDRIPVLGQMVYLNGERRLLLLHFLLLTTYTTKRSRKSNI